MRRRTGPRAVPVVLAACAGLVACAGPVAPPSNAQATLPPTAAVVPILAPTTTPPAPAVVVLDPGHNGGNATHPREVNRQVPDGRGGTKACNTTGTQTDAGYAEHAFTFDVASRVRSALAAQGITVVMTRPDDQGVGPCVDERGAAGEKAGADAVVAIHADGAAAPGHGFHVALSDPPLNPAQEGPAHALGSALRDAFEAGGFTPADYIGHDGLSDRVDLAGLALATRPTALVECANMRNPDEARVVSSPEGRQRYADAITRGILTFLGRA